MVYLPASSDQSIAMLLHNTYVSIDFNQSAIGQSLFVQKYLHLYYY